jgi:hypothetical protein
MAWLRTPLFVGALLLFLGAVYRVAVSVPETGPITTTRELQRVLAYQHQAQPLRALEPRYQPFAFAFVLAGSDAEVAAIKQTLDAQLAHVAAIRARGLAGVPDYVGEGLVGVDIVLMSLGGALLFRSFAFVLATGFGIGVVHEMLVLASTLTGGPSELYLGAVLAALVWSALFWAARAFYEGRLRFGT